MLLGVNWFLQQHFLYSWCKISHKEMASWLCDFMGSFLRELPRNASCMQGVLLFLFRFFAMFDVVTSHNYLLILLSVSQQRGFSIFTTVKLSVALCTCFIVAHLKTPKSSLQGLSDEVRTWHCCSYFSGIAYFCPGPQAQLDAGKITGLKATWGLSGQWQWQKL